MAANWSEIPEELVSMFVERLVCVIDLIRFGCVCKRWRDISISEKEKKKKKPYSPLLMLANADNDNLPSDVSQGVRSFVIPGGVNKKMSSFDVVLPKAQGRRCWGSPHGWVVTVGLDLDIGLLNPLTGAHISLPPQPILQKQCLIYHPCPPSYAPRAAPDRIISHLIRKFALGWHQSSQSWLVMAIFGTVEEVAFSFAGIENSNSPWTCINLTADSEDVILFQGQIYIIAFGGTLKVYDPNDPTTPKAIGISPAPGVGKSDTFYLVEFDGHLHFVARYFSTGEEDTDEDEDIYVTHVTTSFRVWRFDFSKTEWCDLDDLGEYALFVGNNTSFAISTIAYPDFSKNCIYFTDDRLATYNDQFCDMGVYDYQERIVKKPFDIANMGAFSKFSRPTFFMPTL